MQTDYDVGCTVDKQTQTEIAPKQISLLNPWHNILATSHSYFQTYVRSTHTRESTHSLFLLALPHPLTGRYKSTRERHSLALLSRESRNIEALVCNLSALSRVKDQYIELDN